MEIKCSKCNSEDIQVRRKIWVSIIVALLFFPIGLLYLLVPRYKCKECKKIF